MFVMEVLCNLLAHSTVDQNSKSQVSKVPGLVLAETSEFDQLDYLMDHCLDIDYLRKNNDVLKE